MDGEGINIKRLEFSIDIHADMATIWKHLWEDENYRDWSSVFFEGSYVVTDQWKEGSKVHFLGPDQNGIYSEIVSHVVNETIEFKHIGNVIKGQEQPIDEATKKWTGATEKYTIQPNSDFNTLRVDIDVMEEHLEFMLNTFPRALQKIKENCIISNK